MAFTVFSISCTDTYTPHSNWETLSPRWTDERNKWCSFAFCSHICFGVISADTRQSEISTFHLAALLLLCGIFLRRHHLSTVSFFCRYFSCIDSIELIVLYFNYKIIGTICESGSVFSFVPMMPFGGNAPRHTQSSASKCTIFSVRFWHKVVVLRTHTTYNNYMLYLHMIVLTNANAFHSLFCDCFEITVRRNEIDSMCLNFYEQLVMDNMTHSTSYSEYVQTRVVRLFVLNFYHSSKCF